jgi:hypothetical protein
MLLRGPFPFEESGALLRTAVQVDMKCMKANSLFIRRIYPVSLSSNLRSTRAGPRRDYDTIEIESVTPRLPRIYHPGTPVCTLPLKDQDALWLSKGCHSLRDTAVSYGEGYVLPDPTAYYHNVVRNTSTGVLSACGVSAPRVLRVSKRFLVVTRKLQNFNPQSRPRDCQGSLEVVIAVLYHK